MPKTSKNKKDYEEQFWKEVKCPYCDMEQEFGANDDYNTAQHYDGDIVKDMVCEHCNRAFDVGIHVYESYDSRYSRETEDGDEIIEPKEAKVNSVLKKYDFDVVFTDIESSFVEERPNQAIILEGQSLTGYRRIDLLIMDNACCGVSVHDKDFLLMDCVMQNLIFYELMAILK